MNEASLKHFSHIHDLISSSTSFVAITLVDSRGHAPQDRGAKALVTAQGLHSGTVGGGKVEAKAVRLAQELLLAQKPVAELHTWNLQTDIDMSCGGEVKLFFEPHLQNCWPIAVFGAGHVSQSLNRLLINLNCSIHCIDSRPEWLDKLPDSPRLKKILCNPMEGYADNLPENSFVMLMTQGHGTDVPVLKRLLSRIDPPYVGVIGSSVKAMAIRKELAEAGIAPERIEKIFCPMGLPIGDNSPDEIAISMTAQIIKVRDELRGSTSFKSPSK